MKTQKQLFTESQQKVFDLNRAFMELVNDPVNPMTNADLTALIKRKPEKYGRFSGFIGKLKD
jgi:hypothetical protein